MSRVSIDTALETGSVGNHKDIVYSIRMENLWVSANTDGILFKLFRKEDKDKLIGICSSWEQRTGFKMGYDEYDRVIQSNVNNYILRNKKGYLERKGAFVKELSLLDNDLPIVNRAIVEYFINGIPPEQTIMASNELIDFQKITKITGKYEYGSHNGKILSEKVHRCFASKDANDGTLYKKHKEKDTLDKTTNTPEQCFIINSDIREMEIPSKLDKNWYITLANKRIEEFVS